MLVRARLRGPGPPRSKVGSHVSRTKTMRVEAIYLKVTIHVRLHPPIPLLANEMTQTSFQR
jgi:hypothetical protein